MLNHFDPDTTQLNSQRRFEPSARWSFTTVGDPVGANEVLIVCAVSVPNLGLEDLAATVAAADGAEAAIAWRRARAQEFALRLRDMLARHLSDAELMIHVQDGSSADVVRVILTRRRDDAAAVEGELTDRVRAIRDRAWATWSEQLRVTVRALYAPADFAPTGASIPSA